MGYILTGAVMVSGTYVDENGLERRYEIVRGQNVASLGLPPHVEKELVSRVRPMGGRRAKPYHYFTHVDDSGKPSAPDVETNRSVTVASLNEGLHKSRVEAGVVEPEEEFVPEIPQPETPEDNADNDAPATTVEEVEKAAVEVVEPAVVAVDEVQEEAPAEVVEPVAVEVVEEPAAEPVVSPVASEDEVKCPNPDCAAKGDVAACDSDTCPVNEAPVEAVAKPVVKQVSKPASKPANKSAKKSPSKGAAGKKGPSQNKRK